MGKWKETGQQRVGTEQNGVTKESNSSSKKSGFNDDSDDDINVELSHSTGL